MRFWGLVLIGAIACSAPAASRSPAAVPPAGDVIAPPAAPVAQELRLDVGDVVLAVRTLGDRTAKATVVGLHGGPGLSHEYMRAFEHLAADGIRVVLYDQRATGNTTAPEDPNALTFAAQARDLEQLRVALGTDTIDLVAHSYGGLIAMAYATNFPQHVRSLIFVDSMPPKFNDYNAGLMYLNEAIGAAKRAGIIPDPLPPLDGDDCGTQLLALMPVYFHDRTHPATKHLGGSRCQESVTLRTIAANEWFDFTEPLGAVTVPTLIIHGEADPFRRQMADAIAAAMPAAKLVILEKCGHIPFEECPDRFWPLVRAALAARP